MKSIVATSYELDNAAEAARQLTQQIDGFIAPDDTAVGILLCDADTDCAVLSGLLSRQLGCPVAGMTTLAALNTKGRCESCAVLTIYTGAGCAFAAAVSPALPELGPAAGIEDAYLVLQAQVAGGVEQIPRLIMAFCPYGMPFSGDKYPAVLSRLAPGVPVMGGVASDDYDYERARTFLSGHAYSDALVLIGFYGDVHPRFAIRHVTSRFAERIRRITAAEDNVVQKVGDETFVEYLAGFGLDTTVPDPLLAFTSYPMMLTTEDEGEVPLMRHIGALDLESGTGSFLGDVPVGAAANICLINKEDVITAARQSMTALLDDCQKGEGSSSIFCISCCGRAMILGADSDAEGEVLAEMLPEGFALSGAYCLGEICPTLVEDGKVINRFHNCSITLCVM
jgi:hypothetical protein